MEMNQKIDAPILLHTAINGTALQLTVCTTSDCSHFDKYIVAVADRIRYFDFTTHASPMNSITAVAAVSNSTGMDLLLMVIDLAGGTVLQTVVLERTAAPFAFGVAGVDNPVIAPMAPSQGSVSSREGVGGGRKKLDKVEVPVAVAYWDLTTRSLQLVLDAAAAKPAVITVADNSTGEFVNPGAW
jgi:hypothetical protein